MRAGGCFLLSYPPGLPNEGHGARAQHPPRRSRPVLRLGGAQPRSFPARPASRRGRQRRRVRDRGRGQRRGACSGRPRGPAGERRAPVVPRGRLPAGRPRHLCPDQRRGHGRAAVGQPQSRAALGRRRLRRPDPRVAVVAQPGHAGRIAQGRAAAPPGSRRVPGPRFHPPGRAGRLDLGAAPRAARRPAGLRGFLPGPPAAVLPARLAAAPREGAGGGRPPHPGPGRRMRGLRAGSSGRGARRRPAAAGGARRGRGAGGGHGATDPGP